MASITCTNCGAVLKTPTEIAPGKKVKCPKCQQAFVVLAPKAEEEPEELEEKQAPADEEEKDADDEDEAPKKKKAKDDDDEEDEGEAPKKKKAKDDDEEDEDDAPKKKGKGDDAKSPAKKGGSMMYILLGVGGLLACCCCGGGGGGGWWVYSNYLAAPPFHGYWAEKSPLPIHQVQFLKGGNAAVFMPFEAQAGSPAPNAKWKIIDDKSFELTLNDSSKKISWTDSSSAKFEYKISGDELTLTNTAGDKKSIVFKKVPDK